MNLVTCFKNKSPTFFTFDKFYKKYWKINTCYYIIGYTSEANKEFIHHNYILKTCIVKCYNAIDPSIKNIEIVQNVNGDVFILYETLQLENIPARTWDYIKNKLMVFFYKVFSNIDPIISIDSDEFLYISDITKIGPTHRFHYLEIMLEDEFDLESDIEWCIQSWCNIKYFGQNKTTQDCTSCKTFNFDHSKNYHSINKYMLSFKHSGNTLLYSGSACELVKDKQIDLKRALERGVCFHFLGFTREQLIQSKEKRWNNKWDTFFTQNAILKEAFGTVICNVLKEYIDPRDLICF